MQTKFRIFPGSKYRKLIFLLLITVVYSNFCTAQNQSELDSLESLYRKDDRNKKYLKILELLAEKSTTPDKKLKYSNELLQLARKKDSARLLYTGHLQKGNALVTRGDFSDALENYFKAASLAKTEKELAIIKVTLGDVYSLTKNHRRSINYYNEAIEIFRNNNYDSLMLG